MKLLQDARYFTRLIFAFTVCLLMVTGCSNQTTAEYYLYVGTYTGESSEGIYVMKFAAADGSITPVDTVSGVENPSYLAISPDRQYLYAVNENADSADAAVSAFSIDRGSGRLAFLNRQLSGGGAPCYVQVDAEGKAVFVGNYLGGSLAMFPIGSDGSLLEAETVIEHQGSSVNSRRQESPHVHCTLLSPDNQMLFVADLGTDRVTGYAFDADGVNLDMEPSGIFEAEPGAGPRHLTLHPSGRFAYLINELNGTVVAFEYGEDNKSLNPIQTVGSLPDSYEGAVSGADIHVSPDGKFLYVSNREDLNNIVIYSINPESGELSHKGEVASGGIHPRNFVIEPTGRYLLVANRHSDNIVVFERDRETGLLEPTGNEIKVSQPVCLKLMAVE